LKLLQDSNEESIFHPNEIKRLTMLAQLRCPGGALENTFVLGTVEKQGGKKVIRYVHKDQEGFVTDSTGQHGVLSSNGVDVSVQEMDLPRNPDDKKVFPLHLLDQIRSHHWK
jgi:hypothetical protein